MRCLVKGCTSYWRKRATGNVRYFSFPKDSEIAKKWHEVCKEDANTTNGRICSLHFDQSCYEKSLQQVLLQYSPKTGRKLKPDAIPTLHLVFEHPVLHDAMDTDVVEDSARSDEAPIAPIAPIAVSHGVTDAIASTSTNGVHVHTIVQNLEQKVAMLEMAEKEMKDKERHMNKIVQDLQQKLAAMEKAEKERQENKEKAEKTTEKLLQQKLAAMEKAEKERLKNQEKAAKTTEKLLKLRVKENMQDLLKRVFTPGQIKMLLDPNIKRIKWSSEDIASAISLRCISPKGYRYLLNVVKLPLPAFSTLRRWANSIKFDVGVIDPILDCMKFKGRGMQDFQKLVVITFDEVYLSPKVAIDRETQQVIGPHKTCQVIMVRSLFSHWKQPVYYAYDTPMTKDIIEDIIKRLHDIEYTVVAVVSDMGPGNMGLWKQLGIGVEPMKTYFQHPCNCDLRVYVFADIPHLLKLLRNHFLDKGFTIDGILVGRKCIERVLALNCRDLKVTYSISQYHLDVKGSERQKVLPAAQLFSNKTAAGLEFYGQNGYLEDLPWKETARAIHLFNNWFDVFNSSNKFGKHECKNAYGINLEKQNAILHEMTDLVSKMKIGSHQKLVTFQKGIIVSNNSLEGLLPYLIEKYSNDHFAMEYLITTRLNQDLLENFFSFVRASGGACDHPTALDFKFRLKKFVLGKHSTILFCGTSNVKATEPNVSCFVSPLSDSRSPTEDPSVPSAEDPGDPSVLSNSMLAKLFKNEKKKSREKELCDYFTDMDGDNNVPVCDLSSFDMSADERELLESFEESDIIDTIEHEGLKYIAGYVAYKFKAKYENLGTETYLLPLVSDVDWLQFISRGKCMYPSEDLLKAAQVMDSEFHVYHGTNLRKEKGIFDKLTIRVQASIQPIQIPQEVIACLVRTRTYIRVRTINYTIALGNKNRAAKRKIGKFTNIKVS